MEKEKKKKGFSYRCFRILRWFVWLFFPKMTLDGLENLPEGPCIIVSNHCQMNGPISGELYFPGSRAIWCAGEMMHLKDVPAYAYRDFWSMKPQYIRWLFKAFSYLIAPISVCVFNNAHTIPVYRDTRIMTTFKNTLQALMEGSRVIIFPEHDEPYSHVVNGLQEGFVNVARMYYKRTGKELPFVPMYIAPKLKKMYLGKATLFRPDENIEFERTRICSYAMKAITDMAVSLPRHRVVPYRNLTSKKDYPFNIPEREENHNEKAGC